MISTPLVSVVITCFNDGIYVPDAVASVESSGFENQEIVVVNDGSTDGETLEILANLSDRFQVLHQPNQGASAARNAGIALAKGQYILPLDADNRVCPALFLEGTRILNQHPEIGMVYGDREVFGERSGTWVNHPPNLGHMLYHAHIDTCALYRKEMWADVGGYDPLLPTLEDWMFWLQAMHRGWAFQYVHQVFFRYQYRSTSKSRRYHQNPKAKLALTEYFYPKKEQFLKNAVQIGQVQRQEAQVLRIKWTAVLAYRNFRFGSAGRALVYLRKSAFAGTSLWQVAVVWASLIFNRKKT